MVNNQVLVQVHLTVGPMSPRIHPVVISQVLDCIIRIDMFSNWQDPHVGFLTCVVSNIWMRDQERCVQEVGLWGEHSDVIKDPE